MPVLVYRPTTHRRYTAAFFDTLSLFLLQRSRPRTLFRPRRDLSGEFCYFSSLPLPTMASRIVSKKGVLFLIFQSDDGDLAVSHNPPWWVLPYLFPVVNNFNWESGKAHRPQGEKEEGKSQIAREEKSYRTACVMCYFLNEPLSCKERTAGNPGSTVASAWVFPYFESTFSILWWTSLRPAYHCTRKRVELVD